MSIDNRLSELGLQLPDTPKPVGAYQPVVMSGDIAYLSGQIAKPFDGKLIRGKVGKDLTLAEGQEAARVTALNVVSVVKNYIGFDKFDRFLRVVGYVQCDEFFYDIPQVMNSASELFSKIFGENGVHARSAVGMSSLPLNTAVEIEATIKIK